MAAVPAERPGGAQAQSGLFSHRRRPTRGATAGRRLRRSGWVEAPPAPALLCECPEPPLLEQPGRPSCQTTLNSLGRASAPDSAPAAPPPSARRPSTAAPAPSPCGRRPLPHFSSRCRTAEAGAVERPAANGEDASEDTWACGAAGIYLNGVWILKAVFLKIIASHLEEIVHQVNHLEVLLDPLVLERNLSEHANKIQNSQQGIFQLWSYPLNKESTMESRDFKVSSEENGLNVTSNSVRLFTPNQSLTSATVDQQVVAYPGLQQPAPLDLCWAYADGDFCKNRNEPPINLCSAIESSSSETSTALNWNFKYGNNNLEEIVTDESDLSENEKTNDTLPTYFKKMDLNLKPETIENFEESFTEEPSDIFPYPDFLPPPFSTLDLHKLALSKSENWKAAMEPPESSIEHLITRLLEMERLQHITIQKEKPRLQSNLSTPAVTERPPSKAMPKVRQPKFSDSLTLPTPCVEKSKEKRKNNSGSCKLEQNHSKWNWNSVGKYRWNSRQASLKTSFTTKQVITTYDDFKSPPNSILNPSQELSTKPSIAQTTQSLVKIVPAGCLPTRSPASALPITLSFSEHQREEINPPRTKKKLYQKNIVLNRPFCVQKLNCLSPSFIAKGKCSPIDQK